MKFATTLRALAAATILSGSTIALAQAQSPLPNLNPAAAPAAIPADPAHVVAVIDGKDITVAQLDELADTIDPNLARMPDEQRRLTTLRIYVDMIALSHAAVDKGLDKGPEFEKRMDIARSNVLQQLYFQKEIMDKVSDSELKARYDKEIANLPKEEEVHARHILVKTKEEAEKIIAELDKGGKFEELAKKSSQDGSASVGGDLGYFSHGQMVEPFEKAAFALKPGEYTKTPVETPFGWHVIKLEDRRPKQPPALDDVKDAIKAMIVRERYQQEIGDLRAKLNPKYPDEAVAKAMAKPDDEDAPAGEGEEDNE